MKINSAIAFIIGLGLTLVAPAAEPVKIEAAQGEQEGRELVLRLREMRPPESFTNSGRLFLRDDAKRTRRDFPVTIETSVAGQHWQVNYQAQLTPPVSLLVQRTVTAPPRYQLMQASETNSMMPFAGTDFWLADLGMEFVYWPQQRVLTHEMRRSEWCWVLESSHPQPAPGAYARVVSWVHTESGGIVHAEAYDVRGKLWKVFEPKSFEKINGRWEVREIEIRNEQTSTRTTLRFNLDAKGK